MKRVLVNLATFVARGWASVLAIFVLLLNFRKISDASYILLCDEGGFGHTLSAPDWLRRFRPEERWLVLFVFQKNRHNPWIRELWGRDRFIWVPGGLNLPRLGYVSPIAFRAALFSFIQMALRRMFSNKEIFGYLEMVAATPVSCHVAPNGSFGKGLEARLFDLCVNESVEKVYLPVALRKRVGTELKRVVGADTARYCNLFIRKIGVPIERDHSSINRDGSELNSYLPAIRVLVEQGYHVLLTGGHILSQEVRGEFGSSLIDGSELGVDRDLFYIFAGTESEIHVGQLSGGSAFTHVNRIPALVVNAFPFGHCLPGATVYYKKLVNESGEFVDPRALLDTYFFDYNVNPDFLIENSAAELEAAVRDFVENRNDMHPYGVLDKESGLYSESLAAGNARISPAWVKQ